MLGNVEMMDRIVAAGARFHFDGNELTVQGDDQVDLAASDTLVAVDDRGSTIVEESGGDSFA